MHTVQVLEEDDGWPETEFLDVIGPKIEFSSLLFAITSTTDFTPLPHLSRSGLELFYNVNILYRNLKSENSQDYAQKPQRTCSEMNSASGGG